MNAGAGPAMLLTRQRLKLAKDAKRSMSEAGQKCRFDALPATFAVGTRVTSRPPHRSVRAQFGHTACMGLSLSRGRHAILVVLCIPFFCSTRAASILPSRPHISIAGARSGGQGRRFFSAAADRVILPPI